MFVVSRANCLDRIGLCLLASVLVACVSAPAAAQPNETTGAAKKAPPGRQSIRVYPLRFASAESATQVVIQQLGQQEGVRVAADQRSNRLIVFGSPAIHERVSKLLEAMDSPAPDRQQIKMFHLQHVDMESAARVMELFKGQGESPVQFAVDEKRGTLVVRGDEASLKVVEAVVLALDRPQEKRVRKGKMSGYRVSVYWLASGGEAAGKPAATLAPVVKELKSIGMEKVNQVAQMAVHSLADDGSKFSNRGNVSLGGVDASFEVVGRMLQRDGEQVQMQIQILAKAGQNSPVQLETEIRTRLKQFVVLGVAPNKASSYAFVVRIDNLP